MSLESKQGKKNRLVVVYIPATRYYEPPFLVAIKIANELGRQTLENQPSSFTFQRTPLLVFIYHKLLASDETEPS